jgi:hypothetical protein
MLAGALLAGGPAANAATFILIPIVASDGTFTLSFHHDNVVGEGFEDASEFEDIFEFALPAAGKLSGSIVTIANTAADTLTDKSNINFKFVTLNLSPFVMSPVGQVETGARTPLAALSGTQRLVVHGFTGGRASYAGTINFAPDPVASVPEPAAWALMILGFGGAGAAIRSRRRGTAAHA